MPQQENVVFRRIGGRIVPIKIKGDAQQSSQKKSTRKRDIATAGAGAALMASNHPGKRTIGTYKGYNINRTRVGSSVKFEARKPWSMFADSKVNLVHTKKRTMLDMAINRHNSPHSNKLFHRLMQESASEIGSKGRKRFAFNAVSKEGLAISRRQKTRLAVTNTAKGTMNFVNRATGERFLSQKLKGFKKYKGKYVIGSARIADSHLARTAIKGTWGKGRAGLFIGGAAMAAYGINSMRGQ